MVKLGMEIQQQNIDNTPQEAPVKERLKPPWKKGQSGNPKGRPKGSFSIKDAVRKHLESHPDDFKEFVEHFIKKNRELAWTMLESKPPQDLNLGSNPELPFVIKIVKDDGDKGENSEAVQQPI